MIAAPNSGAGKTTVSLAISRALRNNGKTVVTAKSGPDYIDPRFLEKASGNPCINLDSWAMSPDLLKSLATTHMHSADILVVEAAMGFFDGSHDGTGSAADLAYNLSLPIILVVDCASQAQSIGALVQGFINHRTNLKFAGVILNRVASARHESMLRAALKSIDIKILGVIFRTEELKLPSRHLGLVQATEHKQLEKFLDDAATIVQASINVESLIEIESNIQVGQNCEVLSPLGQNIAIARDEAFAFTYHHLIDYWQRGGVEISYFSPLEDEFPSSECDAIYLPGGYPELHAERIAKSSNFHEKMRQAASIGTLIYGECGGYMVLGKNLRNKNGIDYPMLGLLSNSTSFETPKLHLGYRKITDLSGELWDGQLAAHEFHYATLTDEGTSNRLYSVLDSQNNELPAIGNQVGRVMGSFAHVICKSSTN